MSVCVKVKAAYKYQAEDVDELNFEVGEIIQVVEYDDPDEQVILFLIPPITDGLACRSTNQTPRRIFLPIIAANLSILANHGWPCMSFHQSDAAAHYACL